MKRTKICASLLLVSAILCTFFPAIPAFAAIPPESLSVVFPEGGYVPGQVLVKLQDEVFLSRDDIGLICEPASRGYGVRAGLAASLFRGMDIVSVKDLTDLTTAFGERESVPDTSVEPQARY